MKKVELIWLENEIQKQKEVIALNKLWHPEQDKYVIFFEFDNEINDDILNKIEEYEISYLFFIACPGDRPKPNINLPESVKEKMIKIENICNENLLWSLKSDD